MSDVTMVSADRSHGLVPRPEYVRDALPSRPAGEIARTLPAWRRVWGNAGFRKILVVAFVLGAWQAYTVIWDVQPLVFPSVVDTVRALVASVLDGELLARVWTSMKVLLTGYAIGMGLAGVLTVFAVTTRFGGDVLSTLTAMFNPLPAIALLPLALLWFGLGVGSLVFVLVHSVLWAVALNSHAGFQSVSETQRMVGRNYGLKGVPLVVKIMIPGAFASILTGLKIGWAFAWRTLIAAELVFGASSGGGGLGWFIYENSQNLYTDRVFAGLLAVMLIGVVVENGVFRTIEARTVRRWGMQR